MSLEVQKFFYYAEEVETRLGFEDEELWNKVMESPFVTKQVEAVASEGFRYVGDAQESNKNSKAYTDPEKKWIFIGRKKTVIEAVLSLSYEMTNAKNGKELNEIYHHFSADLSPGKCRAARYAKAILRVEARAVYSRSFVAIELGQESLVRNKKYLEFVKKNQDDPDSAVEHIFEEMVVNGTVHEGRVKAFDHYVNQYWEFTLD